ncbi:hypothetical protein RJ641_003164 [Dillenia turbinata]|uniref:Uncharacterized protein n=1 Tax=Dillenia turbinata TaxID=194707 RepID=A0AAN8VK40_9MAGN
MASFPNNNGNGSSKKPDDENSGLGAAIAAGAMALAGLGLYRLFSGPEKEAEQPKMMKAPGRDNHMRRDDFEDDPRGYFRGLRGKQ